MPPEYGCRDRIGILALWEAPSARVCSPTLPRSRSIGLVPLDLESPFAYERSDHQREPAGHTDFRSHPMTLPGLRIPAGSSAASIARCMSRTAGATQGYSHIVIGAGAIGSAAAYWLAQGGAERVLVLEQFEFGHAFGSSGDHSRIIRRAYHREEYTALTDAMFAAWAQVEERSGLQVYTKTGGIDLAAAGSPGAAEIDGYRRAMDAAGIRYDELTIDDIRTQYPQWNVSDDTIGIHQADGGILDIRRSVSAHVSLARAAGVEFRSGWS